MNNTVLARETAKEFVYRCCGKRPITRFFDDIETTLEIPKTTFSNWYYGYSRTPTYAQILFAQIDQI